MILMMNLGSYLQQELELMRCKGDNHWTVNPRTTPTAKVGWDNSNLYTFKDLWHRQCCQTLENDSNIRFLQTHDSRWPFDTSSGWLGRLGLDSDSNHFDSTRCRIDLIHQQKQVNYCLREKYTLKCIIYGLTSSIYWLTNYRTLITICCFCAWKFGSELCKTWQVATPDNWWLDSTCRWLFTALVIKESHSASPLFYHSLYKFDN